MNILPRACGRVTQLEALVLRAGRRARLPVGIVRTSFVTKPHSAMSGLTLLRTLALHEATGSFASP
jgi:hypothetical protein